MTRRRRDLRDLAPDPDTARRNELGQPIGEPVDFGGATPLEAVTLTGRHCRIEPLRPEHAAGLFGAVGVDPAPWTYLPAEPCATEAQMAAVIEQFLSTPGWFCHAITALDGTILGTATYLRVFPGLGTAEVGAILYGSRLRRSAAATEAMTLLAAHVFASGYRRYEWKCDALNAPSRAAARRLGFRFEGVWRNALVYKGRNRDTAWYAMTDADWAALAPVHESWLAGADESGQPFRLSEAVAELWEG